MSTLYTVVSLMQFAAITYLLIVAIEHSRAFTLAKNSAWVRENRSFAQRYRTPSPILPVVLFGIAALWFAAVSLTGTYDPKAKMIAAFVPLAIGAVIVYFTEKKIASQIEESPITQASLTYRTLETYVNRPTKIAVTLAAFLPIGTAIALFASGKIGTDLFMYNLLSILIFTGISYGSLIYQIKQKLPHDSELESPNRHSLAESYRTVSVKILSWAVIVISIILLAEQAVQLFGMTLTAHPLLRFSQERFGATPAVTPLFTAERSDLILSALSIPLFILIARLKLMRDVRSSRLFQ